MEVCFFTECDAHTARMLPGVSKKNNFLEILALLHHVSSWIRFGILSNLFRSWHGAKVRGFQENYFFRNFRQYSKPGRCALHKKVNFHGKTSVSSIFWFLLFSNKKVEKEKAEIHQRFLFCVIDRVPFFKVMGFVLSLEIDFLLEESIEVKGTQL